MPTTTIPPVQIRCATAEDLPAINDIYNHYVLNSTCTYQEEPETMHDRQRGSPRTVRHIRSRSRCSPASRRVGLAFAVSQAGGVSQHRGEFGLRRAYAPRARRSGGCCCRT